MRSGSATMTMRRIAGTAMPTPMPITKRPASSGTTSRAMAISSEPGDAEHHAAEHELAGVAAIGERGDEDLREEPGEEADADHRAEGRLADAVLVADVVEHAEQGAVAHRQQGEDQPERHEERRARATVHGSAP